MVVTFGTYFNHAPPKKKGGFRHVVDICGCFVLVIMLIIKNISILTKIGGSLKKLKMDNTRVLDFK